MTDTTKPTKGKYTDKSQVAEEFWRFAEIWEAVGDGIDAEEGLDVKSRAQWQELIPAKAVEALIDALHRMEKLLRQIHPKKVEDLSTEELLDELVRHAEAAGKLPPQSVS